ncbi:photosystem II core complex proteins psbY, chloroplastic [Panicum miliaceum]|uniref:Photosystem II core complex proteins psbY, chloroplastic n=1 Tax=Panicum miliaceum TaxID=4540 RepID=A0A3L6SNZ0_PANMI|nr:photosystem II core complex proteins psbY, chloroplastic [Panicum miliaceum]
MAGAFFHALASTDSALNQLSRMRRQALVAGAGLGAATAAVVGMACAPEIFAAQELAALAAAAAAPTNDDNRGLLKLLLIVVTPAIPEDNGAWLSELMGGKMERERDGGNEDEVKLDIDRWGQR